MSNSTTGKVWVYRREEIPVGTSKENVRQSFPLKVRDQIEVNSLSPGIPSSGEMATCAKNGIYAQHS